MKQVDNFFPSKLFPPLFNAIHTDSLPHSLVTYSQYTQLRVSPIIVAQSQAKLKEVPTKAARVSRNETVGEL